MGIGKFSESVDEKDHLHIQKNIRREIEMIWEYAIIKTNLSDIVIENRTFYGRNIQDVLKELGKEGWELVGIILIPATSSEPNSRIQYALKRQKGGW